MRGVDLAMLLVGATALAACGRDAAKEEPIAMKAGLYEVRLTGGGMARLAQDGPGVTDGKICVSESDAEYFPKKLAKTYLTMGDSCGPVDFERTGNAVTGKFSCAVDPQRATGDINTTFSGTVSEERFDSEVRRIDAAIPELTDMQVITEMRRLLALLGDGHASIQPPPDRPDLLKALPVVFYLFEEGLFVAGAEADRRDLVGAQVLEIGKLTAERALDAVRPLIARDNEHWPREVGPLLLRQGPLLDALDISSDPERIALKIVRLDGDSETIELTADSNLVQMGQVLPRPPGYLLLPDILGGPPPLYLRNADLSYWFEHLRDEGLVYCQINRVLDEPGESFQDFSERLMDHVDAASPDRLVIDLRWNPGGNTHLVLPFLHRVIGSPANRRGRLFVIIGRRTSSAAMNLTALLDRHTEAIFVGEPTGSSPTFVGETVPFELPYTRVRANVSDLLWQSSWPMDYRTWVPPTIYAPPTFELYRRGRDPALEAILSTRAHLPTS